MKDGPTHGFLIVELVCAALLAASCAGKGVKKATAPRGPYAFPGDYPGWRKLNSEPIIPALAGQRKVAWNEYANSVALTRRRGMPFAQGSILVKEERAVAQDLTGKDVVRDVVRVSVMFKAGPGQPSRDGWVYRAFDPRTKRELSRDSYDPDGCYYCHLRAKATDYVFKWPQ